MKINMHGNILTREIQIYSLEISILNIYLSLTNSEPAYLLSGDIDCETIPLIYSLCGSVGKDFVYHACGDEFKSRQKGKFSNFPHNL